MFLLSDYYFNQAVIFTLFLKWETLCTMCFAQNEALIKTVDQNFSNKNRNDKKIQLRSDISKLGSTEPYRISRLIKSNPKSERQQKNPSDVIVNFKKLI
jgi:hypothetical protein